MTSPLLSCWNLKSYRERLGMNCMIFVYLRLREDSITNEQWYFVMVNITRGWIDVRDDRFSKFRNRKKLWSLESFGKWRHNLNLNNLNNFNLNLVINWHAQRAWRKMSLIPSVLLKVLLLITCHWIVGILKILKKWCYGTWGNKQYINLQAEIYFETTSFCIARDRHQYQSVQVTHRAVGVRTMHGFGTDLVGNPAIWLVERQNLVN